MRVCLKVLCSTLLIGALSVLGASAGQDTGFNLPGLRSPVSLNAYRGRVVYLDFWASWCAPCRKSFPWMNAMQQQYGAHGLSVVAVNLDQDRALADRFLEEMPAEFTVAFDPTGSTAERFDVRVMPSSYLIDRRGEVVAVHRGFRRGDTATLEREIRELLASR